MPIFRVACDDCNIIDMNSFMVQDHIWESITTNKEIILCIKCAEKRLGRRITLHDLKPCNISDMMFMGAYIGQATTNMPKEDILLDSHKWWAGHRYYDYPK